MPTVTMPLVSPRRHCSRMRPAAVPVAILLAFPILLTTDGFIWPIRLSSPAFTRRPQLERRLTWPVFGATLTADEAFISDNHNDNGGGGSSDDGHDDTTISSSPETLRSITFCNLPKDKEPNLLCELLLEVGACATWITDSDQGTAWEEAIFSEPLLSQHVELDFFDRPVQWAAPIWNRCNVTAMFAASIDIASTLDLVQDVMPEYSLLLSQQSHSQSPSYTIETVPNIDWVVTVQRNWKPIVMANGTFVIVFPWHTDEDVQAAIDAYTTCTTSTNSSSSSSSRNTNDSDAKGTSEEQPQSNGRFIPLQLQGGIAFGTGEHPTTELCLEWLVTVVTRELEQKSSSSSSSTADHSITVLDYGSGSGILGLAACALNRNEYRNRFDGAKVVVTAVGIDIDVDACRIANCNSRINNLPMRSYLPPLFTEANEKSNGLAAESTTLDGPSDSTMDENSLVSTDAVSKSLLLKSRGLTSRQRHVSKDAMDDDMNDDFVSSAPWSLEPSQQLFTVAVANIMAGPLIQLASTLYNLIQPGGWIGMSGILAHQGESVVEAYRAAGYCNVSITKELGGWLLVTAQRPSIAIESPEI